MERRVLGAVQRRRGPGIPADHEVVHRHPPLWSRPRRSPTTTWRTFTTASTRRCPACRTARMRTMVRPIRRESTGTGAGGDRHLQQLHHQRARQLDRDGRQHAQHPLDAERADQFGVASDVDTAVGGRADLLDSQHRVSRARRIDAHDGGSPGVVFYHNTVTTETSGGFVGQRALAQQPDARAGHGARDLQRDYQTPYSSSDYNGFRPNPGARGPSDGAQTAARAPDPPAAGRDLPRSRNTPRRPDRIRTASRWTTTSSWTCRNSIAIRRPCNGCTASRTSTFA